MQLPHRLQEDKAYGNRLSMFSLSLYFASCNELLRFYQSREPESKSHDVIPGDWPYTHKAPLARGRSYILPHNNILVEKR